MSVAVCVNAVIFLEKRKKKGGRKKEYERGRGRERGGQRICMIYFVEVRGRSALDDFTTTMKCFVLLFSGTLLLHHQSEPRCSFRSSFSPSRIVMVVMVLHKAPSGMACVIHVRFAREIFTKIA